MEENKLLSLLGLAYRARELSVGQDKVAESFRAGKKMLVLTACDISENVMRKLKAAEAAGTARILPLVSDRAAVGQALGIQGAQVAAVFAESGFAKRILSLKGSDANE